jgi:hypothetical protein
MIGWSSIILIFFIVIIILSLVFILLSLDDPLCVNTFSSTSKSVDRFDHLVDLKSVDAESDMDMIQGSFVHNRSGKMLAWLSRGVQQIMNFATCQNEKITILPYLSFTLSPTENVLSYTVDDTDSLLALAKMDLLNNQYFVEIYRMMNNEWKIESKWITEKNIGSICFDEVSQLLVTFYLPSRFLVYRYTEDLKWENIQMLHLESHDSQDSASFGKIISSENYFTVLSDPKQNGGLGRVYVLKRSSTGEYGLHQNLDNPFSDVLGFGSCICLNNTAHRLFISYITFEKVELYQITIHQNFERIESILNPGSIPHFGSVLTANERYLAISSPGVKSSIYIYGFSISNNNMVQEITSDFSELGKTLWLCPEKEKNRPFETLTLLSTDELSTDFGRLVIFQSNIGK